MYFEKSERVRVFHIRFASGSILPTTYHLFYPIYRDSNVGSLPKLPPPVLDLRVDWLQKSSHIYGIIDHSSKFQKNNYSKNSSCLNYQTRKYSLLLHYLTMIIHINIFQTMSFSKFHSMCYLLQYDIPTSIVI